MADKRGISEQAISRWEWGVSLQDISVLFLIANVLHRNTGSLGYAAEQKKIAGYEVCYPSDISFFIQNLSYTFRHINLSVFYPDDAFPHSIRVSIDLQMYSDDIVDNMDITNVCFKIGCKQCVNCL